MTTATTRPNRPAITAAIVLAATLAAGCADKVLTPRAAGSTRMTLQVIATTERLSAPQQLFVGAVYISSEITAESDSFRILDTARANVTGGTQSFTLKVDITKCLADPLRRGSRDACSVSVVAFLLDQGQSVDTTDVFESSYDFKFVGPFDLGPGSTPVVPSIDLSTSRFAVRRWEGDEALRLGGSATPQFYNGPITGFAAPGTTAPPTLFAITQGQDNIVPPNGGQPTFQPVAQLVVFQNGTWRRVNGPGGGVTFFDVAALSATDVYIAASDGLYHYDGTTISAVSAVRDNLRSVAVTPAGATTRFLVAGTLNGNVWVSNLSTFTRLSTGTTQTIDGVCVTGPNEAFAASRVGGGGLFRFDGTALSSVPANANQGKTDLQCGAPGQAFVTSQTGPGQLLRWTGTTWTPLPNPPAVGRSVQYAVVSPTEIYGAGDSANTNRAFYRYDGSSWREVARTQYTGSMQFRPWADPRGGAAYVASSNSGSTRIDQVNVGSARPVSYHPSFRDVMMTSATNAFVVGVNNLLARWDGTRWTVDAPPAGTPNQQLRGVWTDGPGNAWAVGGVSTVLRWDGTRWNVVSDVNRPIVTAIDNYNAVWGAGGSVWIAGDASILRCRAPSICSTEAGTGGGPLYGIWGTSATSAFAVGANGRILKFDGTTWTPMSTPTSVRLGRVFGTAANNVWAVGDSVLVHYDGTSWKLATPLAISRSAPQLQGFQTNPQLGMWGTSAGDFYVATWYGRVLRDNGVEWSEVSTSSVEGGRIVGIGGYVGGCAIAVTDGLSGGNGAVLLRGVGPTGCLGAPMTGPAVWP